MILSMLFTDHLEDHNWMIQAACSGDDVDRSWWFSRRREDIAEAISVCRECPIRERCLSEARQRGEEYGIWGGEQMNPRPRLCRAGHDQYEHGDIIAGVARCATCYQAAQARAAARRRAERAARRARRKDPIIVEVGG